MRSVQPDSGPPQWIVKEEARNPPEPDPVPFESAHLADLKQLENVCDYIAEHWPKRKGQDVDVAFVEILRSGQSHVRDLEAKLKDYKVRDQVLTRVEQMLHEPGVGEHVFTRVQRLIDDREKLRKLQGAEFVWEESAGDASGVVKRYQQILSDAWSRTGDILDKDDPAQACSDRLESLLKKLIDEREEGGQRLKRLEPRDAVLVRLEEMLHPHGAHGEHIVSRVQRLIDAREELKKETGRLEAFFKENPPHAVPSDPIGHAISVMRTLRDDLDRFRSQFEPGSVDWDKETKKSAAEGAFEKRLSLLESRTGVIEYQVSNLGPDRPPEEVAGETYSPAQEAAFREHEKTSTSDYVTDGIPKPPEESSQERIQRILNDDGPSTFTKPDHYSAPHAWSEATREREEALEDQREAEEGTFTAEPIIRTTAITQPTGPLGGAGFLQVEPEPEPTAMAREFQRQREKEQRAKLERLGVSRWTTDLLTDEFAKVNLEISESTHTVNAAKREEMIFRRNAIAAELRTREKPPEPPSPGLDPFAVADELLESRDLSDVEKKAVVAVRAFLTKMQKGESGLGGGIVELQKKLEDFQGVPVAKPCVCGHDLGGHEFGDRSNPMPGRCLHESCGCTSYSPGKVEG